MRKKSLILLGLLIISMISFGCSNSNQSSDNEVISNYDKLFALFKTSNSLYKIIKKIQRGIIHKIITTHKVIHNKVK